MSLIACGNLFFEDSRAVGKGEQKCKTAIINVRDCSSFFVHGSMIKKEMTCHGKRAFSMLETGLLN